MPRLYPEDCRPDPADDFAECEGCGCPIALHARLCGYCEDSGAFDDDADRPD